MLSAIPIHTDDRVLVDFRTSDDAGVYRWEGGPALVQTVDFFTPIVDDPYIYGEIAAANALSDVYAMGGRPLTALAIAALPKEGLERDTIRAIFQGGFDKLREAGVSLLGGHTVQDPEIKFGYAVTGAIDPDRVLSNSGARPGDVLFLTKPLGTGVIATALKFDRVDPAVADAAIQSMRTLNRAASEAVQRLPKARSARVHRRHRLWPGRPRQRNGRREWSHIHHRGRRGSDFRRGPSYCVTEPVWRDGVERGAFRRQACGSHAGVPADVVSLLFDPQTSGGLLIAAAEEFADQVSAALIAAGAPAWRIGSARAPVDRVLVEVEA